MDTPSENKISRPKKHRQCEQKIGHNLAFYEFIIILAAKYKNKNEKAIMSRSIEKLAKDRRAVFRRRHAGNGMLTVMPIIDTKALEQIFLHKV